MIKSLELYLVTDGNGQEAVTFYQNVFQAEVVSCTTFGQAIPDTPDAQKNLILNANLNLNGIRLQLSDNSPQADYRQGTNMTACIQVDSLEEATRLYEKLAENAQRLEMPLQETPWSPAYGIVIDQFGMTWQINTDIEGYVSDTVTF